jgi:YHS domain-containing protein
MSRAFLLQWPPSPRRRHEDREDPCSVRRRPGRARLRRLPRAPLLARDLRDRSRLSNPHGGHRRLRPGGVLQRGKPLKGRPEFAHEWSGATWHFASAESLAAFKLDPERYAPQFGGYCAYAVGNNYTAKSDPNAWHVEDGKLYLNFNAEVRETWLKNRAALIPSAVKNWPAVLED